MALLRAGCHVDVIDQLGETPLHPACHNNLVAVVQTMCAFGCRLDVVNKVSYPIVVVAIVVVTVAAVVVVVVVVAVVVVVVVIVIISCRVDRVRCTWQRGQATLKPSGAFFCPECPPTKSTRYCRGDLWTLAQYLLTLVLLLEDGVRSLND